MNEKPFPFVEVRGRTPRAGFAMSTWHHPRSAAYTIGYILQNRDDIRSIAPLFDSTARAPKVTLALFKCIATLTAQLFLIRRRTLVGVVWQAQPQIGFTYVRGWCRTVYFKYLQCFLFCWTRHEAEEHKRYSIEHLFNRYRNKGDHIMCDDRTRDGYFPCFISPADEMIKNWHSPPICNHPWVFQQRTGRTSYPQNTSSDDYQFLILYSLLFCTDIFEQQLSLK